MRISDWSSDVCSSDLDNEVRDRSAALAGSDGRQRDERRLEAGPQACVDVAVDLGDDWIAAHFGQKLAHQAAGFPCRRVGGGLFDPAENCVTVAFCDRSLQLLLFAPTSEERRVGKGGV